mmetsp:Transcript_132905/g.284053  ORF Transcript_132905/g.284053 Transcript_132905/m.284053 type:complete len:951 (-) Transcript_132905:50-2902(-)
MAILEATIQVISGAQTEITIFLVAIFLHAVLFGKYRIINKKNPSKVTKRSPRFAYDSTEGGKAGGEQTRAPSNSTAAYVLIRALKPLLHENKDEELLLATCMRETAALSPEVAVDALAFAVESCGKLAVSANLLAAVRKAVAAREVPTTARLSELLLRGYIFLGLKDNFREVIAEVDTAKVRNYTITTLELRTAISSSDLETSMRCIKALAPQWQLACASASSPPHGLIQQLVRLCAEKDALQALVEELRKCEALTPVILECIVLEYAQHEDAEGLKWAEGLALEGSIELTKASLCALVRSACNDDAVLRRFDQRPDGMDFLADAATGRRIADAALRCDRQDVLSTLMGASPEGPQQVGLLKSYATDKRLNDAFVVFEASSEKTACLYNAILDACIDCGNLSRAERIMNDTTSKNIADVVTYNTIIKAHLLSGDLKRAKSAMVAMRSAGLQPNCVTFNELIDASVRINSDEAWVLLDEMKSCGLQPNTITCSILLKGIQKRSRPIDVERTLKVVDSMSEQMDEVLLSSVCEACIRVGRSDLLVKQLHKHRKEKVVQIQGPHTYGSIIRSYGFVEDMRGVWETWKEMQQRKIVPTSITLGCMVEAVVNGDDPEQGHKLIREVLNNPETHSLVNAVIYCSVLKGFSHRKRFDRVWEIYEEMLGEKLQFSIVTYNTLIDACARSCDMGRVQRLMEEMASQDIEPNMITYSTIIKGYCQENRLDRAFELLANMKKASQLRPDEITYNSLLDGCARHGFWDRGNGLLADMQRFGVRPSNFTLSVVVKLANRSKRPEQAFELCDELCKKYNIRPNVHVYNNLVHTCTTHYPATRRALEVFEQMLSEKVRPDTRTYTLLIKGCLSAKDAQDVAGLLRGAVGLRGVHPSIARFEKGLVQPRGGLPSEFIAETLEGLASQCGALQLAMQLLSDLSCVPGIRLDSKLHMRLTSRAINGRF